MSDVAKLGNADFRAQVETAVKGAAEASDGLMGVLKEANGKQAALMADAAKLSVQYGIHEEMIALQQALKGTAGGINVQQVEAAFKALAGKVLQEGHPIQARVKAMLPEIEKALRAKDHTVIGKTIQTLVGENGLPQGAIRDLVAQLQKPIEQSAEHWVKLAKLIENEGELSPAKQLILKRAATAQLPKLKEHIANLEGLGMVLPEEARGQLAKLEQKLSQSAAANAAEGMAAAAPKVEKAAGEAAKAAETTTHSAAATSHTSSGSSYSSSPSSHTPSTTVSGEGRKWYQWLTHEEEAGKVIFSGKRTAIAGAAAAAVAGGIYLLKRDKGDSWQDRTSRPAESSKEATR